MSSSRNCILHLTAYISCFPKVLQTLDHFIHLPHSAKFHKHASKAYCFMVLLKTPPQYDTISSFHHAVWGLISLIQNINSRKACFCVPRRTDKRESGFYFFFLLLIRWMSLEWFWFTSYLWQKLDVRQRSGLFISNLQNHHTTISRRDSHSEQQDSVSRLCFCAGSLNPERLERRENNLTAAMQTLPCKYLQLGARIFKGIPNKLFWISLCFHVGFAY